MPWFERASRNPAGTAPVPHEIAVRIEGEHRRRARTAVAGLQLERLLVVGERGRAAVDDPDDILVVDPDADGIAEDPVVGKRPRPERIDLEPGSFDASLLRERRARASPGRLQVPSADRAGCSQQGRETSASSWPPGEPEFRVVGFGGL